MDVASVVFLLFVLTSVGPVLSAVVVYHDDLSSLILTRSTVPDLGTLEQAVPAVTYLGYEIQNPDSFLRAFFNISNPYNVSMTITTLHSECFCHEDGTRIGFAEAEDLPLEIAPHGVSELCLDLHFTETGKDDVLAHYNSGSSLCVDLRNLTLVMEGVEVNYDRDLLVGPIPPA